MLKQSDKKDEDEDFVGSEDSDDEEETIAEQEKKERGNYKAEIDELQAEGIKRIKKNYSKDVS